MGMRTIPALAVTAAYLVLAVGCGPSRGGGGWSGLRGAPWERAILPPPWGSDEAAIETGIATGKVTSVSEDGLTLGIELDRGTVNVNDPVTVVQTMAFPSPRNFADEVRERRVATARVVEVDGASCTVAIVPDRRNGRVLPGDRVTILSP